MAAAIPQEFLGHFRFAEYHRVDRIKLLDATGGKFGHLFGDNLMNNGDFEMQMYVNASKELAVPGISEPKITDLVTEGMDDAICWLPKRNFISEIIMLINVGMLCCGHKGVWHGGVTSALFDNAFGILGCSILEMAATKYLNIQFRAPILVGDSVALVVSFDPELLLPEKGDRFVAHGKMYNQRGVVVATGESELVDVSSKWPSKTRRTPADQ
ncbi:thioesterase family protein, putative [Babesia caballi]|uniref:Thioesterase family protein, putative n=1 Tax=Babesia caballi TaxID=5871 RepID=A0AAV4LWD3_BABCB|nr:thioesterase family protein, putative [Babesia caballi]